jgi:periplasmic divalent cation tolerance protein
MSWTDRTDRVDAILVLTTVGSEDQAITIARALIEDRLAACVNVLPEMTSVYRWEGAVQEDRERQLIIKTTRPALDAVRERVHALHGYDLPEFLVLPVDSGSERYLQWIEESTGG